MSKADGVWSRLVRKITTDDDELDAEELVKSTQKSGACSCVNAEPGEMVVVAGRLRSVAFTPSDHAPCLSAELFDGSGSVKLVWMGERRIPGIEPGRSIMVRGRVCNKNGERLIFNPWYELQHR